MDFALLKLVHMILAGTSLAGFVLRWTLMMRGSALVQLRLTRILPHVIDTLLLASGVALAVSLQVNPLVQHWLAAKLGGLVVYIVLASIAYKYARSTGSRAVFFGLALMTFAWIIATAVARSPFAML